MTLPIHLTEGDYEKLFPDSVDEFPTVINEQHYIDAWLLNTIYDSLKITEQYIIDHKANIEAAAGDDILGEDGQLIISIPPALYTAYKFAIAWDSNLLEENIKLGEIIFGVTGTLSGGAGQIGPDITTGCTATASSFPPGQGPEKAFDDDVGSYFEVCPAAANCWLKCDLGAGNEKAAVMYTIMMGSWSYPTGWKFQGSNDDINWDDIDIRTAQSFQSQERKVLYNFTNATPYRFYLWLFTGLSGNDLGIMEVEAMALI